jgi:hypothetical protein
VEADAQLILPRADDCINLLLDDPKLRLDLTGSFFYTEGWLNGERTILVERQQAIARYGEKRAERIFNAMMHNYKRVLMVDTGCFDAEDAYGRICQIADTFSLEPGKVKGTLRFLKQLIQGPWTEEKFVIVPPHSPILPEMLHS